MARLPDEAWLPMDPAEKELAEDLGRCRLPVASFEKRFLRDLGRFRPDLPTYPVVTQKQRETLARLAWRYRKQLRRSMRKS